MNAMIVDRRIFFFAVVMVCLVVMLLLLPQTTSAHRSGCHNLHTCPSDNDGYECGDLGYPCDGSSSIKQIQVSAVFVPLAAEKAFMDTFGRKPTDHESSYWKKRFRGDKESVFQMRRAMAWHKEHGSFGPKPEPVKKEDLIKDMNMMFRSVYGRDHTVSENKYWISRLKDKPTAPALIGAMTHHRDHTIQH
jgi:hypothetical protein